MLDMERIAKVYLAIGDTDMRKSIDGLAALVQYSYDLDPFSDSLFVFCNKRRDKIKLLYWSNNGFGLFYKRLERESFRWIEKVTEEKTARISLRQLRWLLDALSPVQETAHKAVTAGNML